MFNQEDLQNERRKQINTLKVFNDNVSETINNSEYRIDFLSGANHFSLHVHLSLHFPLHKPVLKIFPSINHPWVDSTGNEILSAPGLLNFSRHSDLGRVVQAIIRELQLRPPVIIGNSLPNVPPYNSYVFTVQKHQQPYQEPAQNFPVQSNVPLNIPDLSELSLTEMKLLNENEEYLEAYVKSLPSLKDLESMIDSLISTNDSLATENLEKENLLKEKNKDLKGQVEELTELQDKHEMKNHQYDQLVEKYSPLSIKEQLMKSAKVHEAESDAVVENFLDNKLTLEAFLSSYQDKRVVTHRLQTKEERLSYQLEALEKASH